MLRASQSDRLKLDCHVRAVITATLSHGNTVCFVDNREFYARMQFSNLRRQHFADEVNDALSGADFHEHYGSWLYTEYEMGTSVFVQIGKAEEDNDIDIMISSGRAYQSGLPSWANPEAKLKSLAERTDDEGDVVASFDSEDDDESEETPLGKAKDVDTKSDWTLGNHGQAQARIDARRKPVTAGDSDKDRS